MSFEADFRTRVKAAVSAITNEVHWTERPQGSSFPAVVLQVVSDQRTQNMTGFDTFRETRVQVDCFAKTRTQAIALREAALGVVPAANEGSTEFLRAFVNNVLDRGENTGTGFIHRDLIDLTIWHD